MLGVQVLLVTSDPKTRRHMTRALASMGCQVHQAQLTRRSVEPHLQRNIEMFIVDGDGNRAELDWLVEKLYQFQTQAIVLIVSQESANQFILDLVEHKDLNNIIAKQGGISTGRELIDEHELIVTCNKLHRNDMFGMDKYLSTWGIVIRHRELTKSEEKEDALTELGGFLESIDCQGPITSSILTVADELLMNAIYNAPRDEKGNAKYAKRDRRESVQLGDHEHVDLRYACDGRYVGISVSDRFGSLDREVLVRYLRQSLTGDRAMIESKEGGAGVGLHMIAQSATQLIFNIQVGKQTEVIALFYVRSGGRSFRASGRSLNIFLSR
ncbi:MAG: hypothetical protein HY903_18950 [Deltaproteobacteria bacterium]|nr:hypothetical protein [Deltaproteobacteria bacterium]